MVLVAVENLNNSGDDHGDVLACPLASGAAPAGCTMIAPPGMPAQPMAVAWIPPDLIVVAARWQVVAFHLNGNMIVWSDSIPEDLPADIFALTTSGAVVAAAYHGTGLNEVRRIYAYDAGGTRLAAWELNDGTFPLGLSWTSMTQKPDEPSKFYALKPSQWALAEVDPLATQPITDGLTSSSVLHTVSALDDGIGLRVAWVGDTAAQIYFFNDPSVAGPITCMVDGAPCSFAHAVADPTSSTRYLGLCEHPGSTVRELVRLDTTQSSSEPCEVLFDGGLAPLGESWRLARLAVLQ